jgi:GNAT superfamily N-acetyltransferase
LSVPFAAPAATIPITVRELSPDDDLSFLDVREPGITGQEVYDRLSQRRLLAAHIATVYVAVAQDHRVCYMQWLIAPSENAHVRGVYGNLFPPLQSGDALLEGAFTVPAFRGQGVMPSAMAQIAERARAFGGRHVMTFVEEGNAASLKGCAKAGFSPSGQRYLRCRLFYRRVTFQRLLTGKAPSGIRSHPW